MTVTLTKISRAMTAAALLLALCIAAVPAGATEGGGGAYPNGAEDFMAGAVPPPGNYFINYFNYYNANRFVDGNGHKAMPTFNLNVAADVLRFIHVTDKQFLGGFWGMLPSFRSSTRMSRFRGLTTGVAAWGISSLIRSSSPGTGPTGMRPPGWTFSCRPATTTRSI